MAQELGREGNPHLGADLFGLKDELGQGGMQYLGCVKLRNDDPIETLRKQVDGYSFEDAPGSPRPLSARCL